MPVQNSDGKKMARNVLWAGEVAQRLGACSCRESGLGAQRPHGGSQASVTPVLGGCDTLCWPVWTAAYTLKCTHYTHVHTHILSREKKDESMISAPVYQT